METKDTKNAEGEAPTEPPKHCMSTACSGEAVSALCITFRYACKGHRPKDVSAWFGLYVCARCGTQDNAIDFAKAQQVHLQALGQQIGNALGAQSFTIGKVCFAPRAGADKDFAAYVKMQETQAQLLAKEVLQRQRSIVDAANDPANLQ